MLELIYPAEGYAPRIPAASAESRLEEMNCPERQDSHEEMFPVVDPSGEVIGMASRSWCHSGVKLLHPVVHLHIIDRKGRIYLQRRSMDKDIQPGRWDTAVGGHVSYGEQIAEALYRESSEELGFTEYNPVHIRTYIFESSVEKELVSVFAAVGSSFVLTPDGREISEGRFWTQEEIDSRIDDGCTFTPNFVSEFKNIRKSLFALL